MKLHSNGVGGKGVQKLVKFTLEETPRMTEVRLPFHSISLLNYFDVSENGESPLFNLRRGL